jgi:hypothetical protein
MWQLKQKRSRDRVKNASLPTDRNNKRGKISPPRRARARFSCSARSDSAVGRRACRRGLSSRFAAVAFEQSAEPLFTADFAQRNDLVFQVAAFRFRPAPFLGPTEKPIVDSVPLVRAFLVIVRQVFRAQAIQVLRAEDHEPVEAFLFDRLNEPFHEGIRDSPARLPLTAKFDRLNEPFHEGIGVGRTVGVLHGFHAMTLQLGVERLGELGIAVVLHHRNRQVLSASLANERFGLRDDPRSIGMQCGRRQDNLPRFHVQKCEDEGFANPLEREHALREKVTLPERRRVLLEEFVPRSFAAFRAGIETGVLENAFHGVPREGMNAEFFQLAKNPGVAPLVLLGQFQDQLADLFRHAPATAFRGCFLAVLLFRPNPAQQRIGGHDARQLAQHLASQLLGELYQPMLFLEGDRDAFWQLAP